VHSGFKTELQVLKFKFLSDYIGVEQRIKLQLTGKISLKLDSNSSLLLEYGRKNSICVSPANAQR